MRIWTAITRHFSIFVIINSVYTVFIHLFTEKIIRACLSEDAFVEQFLLYGLTTIKMASVVGFLAPPFYLASSYFDVHSHMIFVIMPLHLARIIIYVGSLFLTIIYEVGNARYVNILLYSELAQIVIGFFMLPLVYMHGKIQRNIRKDGSTAAKM